MKKLYIVGGNGFARECCLYIKYLQWRDRSIEFGGFLGHRGYGEKTDYKQFQSFYKGDFSEHKFKEDEYCVIGTAYPEIRKIIYDDLKNANAKFYTLCSPGVFIHEDVEMGEANVFIAPCSPSVNVKIGHANVFNSDIIIGHDVTVGNCNFFGPKCQLLGNVTIGNWNTIGANSIFLPHSKIGNNNKVSPLSSIYKGFRNNCYIHGNPALNIGSIFK